MAALAMLTDTIYVQAQNGWGGKVPLQFNPPAKAGSPRLFAQDHIQTSLEYLQRRDSTAYLGSLLQCSVTRTLKKFLLLLRWNFQFVPTALVPSTLISLSHIHLETILVFLYHKAFEEHCG